MRWLRAAAIVAGLALLMGADKVGSFYVAGSANNTFSCLVSNQTANTQCVGLSGASLSYYITDVLLSDGATAQNLQVVSSTTAGNACATSPANVTPLIFFPVNANFAWALRTPLKVAANSALCCSRSGTTAFSCQIVGYIAP